MSTGLRRRVPRSRRAAAILLTVAVVGAAAVSSTLSAITAPPTKVPICHATSSRTNPYVAEEPAIANNGDLAGGHLNHTGPVFPGPDWGDIIKPYDYVDENGEEQNFPGYNWDEDGQAIHNNGCNPPPPPPEALRPTLGCVEILGEGRFLAHFGYINPNGGTITPSPEQNFFSPGEENRGQPTTFDAGPTLTSSRWRTARRSRGT